MNAVDFLVNLAGLLLWLSWRAIGFKPVTPKGVSIVTTLKKAGAPEARWSALLVLLIVLLVRGIFHWQVGPAVGWTPGLSLGPIVLHFRPDLLDRAVLFSLLSFGQFLGIFYGWLLLLSLVNRRLADTDRQQSWVRMHLGLFERCPAWFKVLLPLIVAMILWSLMALFFIWNQLLPRPDSPAHLFQQSFVLGAGVYFTWQPLIIGVLLLHLLNSYIYLGSATFWNYIDNTAQSLLRPVRWIPLRAGRVDFAPLLGIILVLLIAESGRRGLLDLYRSLPL